MGHFAAARGDINLAVISGQVNFGGVNSPGPSHPQRCRIQGRGARRRPLPRRAIRASFGEPSDVVTVSGQREVDVASGGVRVWAYLICGGNDPSGLLGIVNLRQGYGELDG